MDQRERQPRFQRFRREGQDSRFTTAFLVAFEQRHDSLVIRLGNPARYRNAAAHVPRADVRPRHCVEIPRQDARRAQSPPSRQFLEALRLHDQPHSECRPVQVRFTPLAVDADRGTGVPLEYDIQTRHAAAQPAGKVQERVRFIRENP